MTPRTAFAAVLVALVLVLAACSGDDEDEPAGGGAATTEPAETTATTEPEADTDTVTTDTTAPDRTGPTEGGGAEAPGESPEDQPGGAGDEVPASSQALITGRDGGLHPTVVRVPPFIAIRVVLRSADGVEYSLSANGRSVEAGGEIRSASTLFPGLRPSQRLVLTGPQGEVRIEPTAEPGP
jgi:hypothetical protein